MKTLYIKFDSVHTEVKSSLKALTEQQLSQPHSHHQATHKINHQHEIRSLFSSVSRPKEKKNLLRLP